MKQGLPDSTTGFPMQIHQRTQVTLGSSTTVYVWENTTHATLHISGSSFCNHDFNIDFQPEHIQILSELIDKLKELQLRQCREQMAQLQETLQQSENSHNHKLLTRPQYPSTSNGSTPN